MCKADFKEVLQSSITTALQESQSVEILAAEHWLVIVVFLMLVQPLFQL